jgi:hypothetical protein
MMVLGSLQALCFLKHRDFLLPLVECLSVGRFRSRAFILIVHSWGWLVGLVGRRLVFVLLVRRFWLGLVIRCALGGGIKGTLKNKTR